MPRARKPKPPVESPRLPKKFDRGALAYTKQAYPRPDGLGRWTEERVEVARDAQVRGKFREAVELARSFLTEPAIFTAALNRRAPHQGLKRAIECETRLTGTPAAILEEARLNFCPDTSVALHSGVVADAFDRLAMHEIAVDQIHWEPRPDGSRMDPFVQPWPLENVEWFEIPPDGSGERGLYAFTAPTQALDELGRPVMCGGGWVRIVHGDGRWIVHTRFSDRPWAKAALVALARLWVDMAFGRRDFSRNVESHADDKWIGVLPPSIMPEDDNGKTMLEELSKLYEPRRAMIVPNGTTIKRDEAMSAMWQVFPALLDRLTKSAREILLGQDTSTSGSSQRLTLAQMFGVRDDVVESDVTTIGAGYSTGLIRPWSLINFGRWDRLALTWPMPDEDDDARRESIATRRAAFWADVQAARASGALVDQKYFDDLAKEYGIRAPALASTAPAGVSDAPATVTAHRHPLLAAVGG